MKNFNLEELNKLNEEERAVALEILKQYSETGASEIYNQLLYEDYEEIPVSIEEFLHNPLYLGKGLTDDEGRFTLYPYWENLLKEIYPDSLKPAKYNTLALTGCLGYDTEIPLLSGKKIKIGDLASYNSLDEYVYSFDVETNEFVPGHLIKAFSTGIKPVYKITLDSGESFEATSNHRFMLRNKKWSSIDSGLKVGDSLLPLYREYAPAIPNRSTLYEYIKHPQKDGSYITEKTHRMVMRHKRGPFKGVVHHIDFNPLNNDPRNLLKTTWNAHKMYHAHRGGEQWKTFGRKRKNKEIPEELELRMREGARKGSISRWSKPEEHEKMSALTHNRMANGFAKHLANRYWQGEDRKEKLKQRGLELAERNRNTKNINKYQINKAIKVANLTLKEFGVLSENTYEQTKLKYNMRSGYPSYKSALNRISETELLDFALNYNHKIVKIEYIGNKEVFDLTIEKYHNFALDCGIIAHNSIGIGKSTEAVIIGCYELYRMLCLKNPYIYYGLQPIDLITFAVINITMDAAKGVAWSKIQSLIQSSEWFMKRGSITKSEFPEWKPPKGIELIYGSQPRHIIGRAVFWCFEDEISFQQNQDVEKQKEKAQTLVNTATARMQSRFMKNDVNPTIFILASSKRTEQSFLETFIENKKKNESKTTRIVDEPQWIIRTDKDSKNKFKVAIGNKFLNSEVVSLTATQEELKYYTDRGYTLIDVPMGYYENFIDDIDIALTDIAGISTSGVTRYIAGNRVAAIKREDIQNLFVKDVIEVGNGQEDTQQYYDFIDLERLDRKLLAMPLYIHLDMSISGDKTGIAGVWVIGKKPTPPGMPPSKDLIYRLAFSVSVKAPKGHQISFEKNRQFIRWLRSQGFSIRGISSDTYQSADLIQQMLAEGYNTSVISVDRVKDGMNIPYQTLKSAIYENRLQIYEAPLLTEELIGLERNNNGRVDHSPSGINSKDQSDALCGALYNASQHAEEFAFEYGEDLSLVVDVSGQTNNEEQIKKQITLDFEEELQRAFSSASQQKYREDLVKRDESIFMDFGRGKAKALNPYYLSQGIII